MPHSWDTVADVMGMHGKFSTKEPIVEVQKGLAWAATHYAQVTTGTGCGGFVNTSFTIEDAVRTGQKAARKANPKARLGMYWRTDFALELKECSDFSAEWNAHPEWVLKQDDGTPTVKNYIDYSQQPAADFFAKVMLSTLADGTLDYIYMDGPGTTADLHFPGVSPTRGAAVIEAKHAMIAGIQAKLDAIGKGQNLILNGVDNVEAAEEFRATGAAGVMFDHWSALQFVIRGPPTNPDLGEFNATEMDEAFQLVTNEDFANMTLQVKGWPGPIVHQPGQYPPNIPSPTTPAEKATVAAQRFNNELALFLLVADDLDYWIYSWFWGFYDYIPGDATSTVPAEFFPEAKCKLGAPAGPYTRVGATWTYTRKFAHASVFVDLKNRTAGKVTFDSC
jgi:hypothetical protein